LFTERLHLRCPVEADAAAIIAIVGDWEVARRLGRVPHPYTPEDFRFFMEQRYHADNPASGRVLSKLGFMPVGCANHPCLAEGKDKPSIEVELTGRR
jgi:RimJ/RimL family protein N-acetyltransferase